jgi:hypothetical protein
MLKLPVWKTILLLFVIATAGYVVWFIIYAFFIDSGIPTFFPLNNSQGEYRITKGCPNAQGWDKQGSTQGEGYCVEYKGSGVFGNTNFFRITVGKSQIELTPFINKKVKNIQGKYTSSSKQCIRDKCIEIFGGYAVLDIDKLELVE